MNIRQALLSLLLILAVASAWCWAVYASKLATSEVAQICEAFNRDPGDTITYAYIVYTCPEE